MSYPSTGAPTAAGEAGDYARRLYALLGNGIDARDLHTASALLLGLGDALTEAHATSNDAADQVFHASASDPGTLADLEFRYGVQTVTSDDEAVRQARLVAKVRAAIAGTPQAIESAIAALAPEASILETTATAAIAAGYPRGVYRWAVLVSAATYADVTTRDRIYAIARQMKPAHTDLFLGVGADFRCDDPNSLTDRDLLAL